MVIRRGAGSGLADRRGWRAGIRMGRRGRSAGPGKAPRPPPARFPPRLRPSRCIRRRLVRGGVFRRVDARRRLRRGVLASLAPPPPLALGQRRTVDGSRGGGISLRARRRGIGGCSARSGFILAGVRRRRLARPGCLGRRGALPGRGPLAGAGPFLSLILPSGAGRAARTRIARPIGIAGFRGMAVVQGVRRPALMPVPASGVRCSS